MGDHISIDELADADAGLLDDGRRSAVEEHLVGCADCRAQIESLHQVTARLAAESVPAMPTDVFARLDAALREESSYRAAGVSSLAQRPPGQPELVRPGSVHPRNVHTVYAGYLARPTLGHFGQDRPRARRGRWVAPLLAAAAAAALVGFGGYVLSASAGLNEPLPVAAAVNSRDLSADARALEQSRNLNPHRFSRAWRCARSVTEGRINGLASTTVDGGPALLVYTREGATTSVTVVTGCDAGRPEAGRTAQLSG